MLRRAKLIVAYDGTLFHGFAENDGVRTVMGVLREAMEKIVRQPVELVGAGRTDAGVHAWGQVVSCDLPDDMDLDVARTPGQPHVRPRGGRAIDGVGRVPRLQCPVRWQVAALPLPRLERAEAEPVSGVDVVARRPAAVDADAATDLRSVDRRARLLVVLPAPEGARRSTRRIDGPQGDGGQVVGDPDRSRRRVCCVSRSGPMRSAIRWCDRSSARWSMPAPAACRPARFAASCWRRIDSGPGRLRRHTVCACGRSGYE